MTLKTSAHKESWMVYGAGALIVIFGFVLAYQFVKPAPPDHIRIATGSAGNAYYQFATAYAEQLAQDRISLEVIETSGSLANLGLLNSNKVEIAFVQGGLGDSDAFPGLLSLGSMYFEPLWVFVRSEQQTDRLTSLKGLRLAIGPQGSGTRAFALQLLKANGIEATNTPLFELSGQPAAKALLAGEIDALFAVTSPKSALIRQLLENDQVRPVSFSRAQAYARRFDFLSALELPEGSIDLERNIPRRAIKLVAPAATLVTNEEFHPALTSLLLQAAAKTHGGRTLFANRGEFPSPQYVDFPLNDDAERFYKRGTPFLQRYLPFWAANLIDRLIVMILPLVTLMIPLMKILPPTYRWRVRSRIYRWYDQLRDLDFRVSQAATREQSHQLVSELDEIEQDVMHVTVPKSYADAQYNLRLHIRLIRERLDRQLYKHDANTV
ncbi:TAXI family TRAP transporter solute-binding subunit [Motiliproteus sediminis]|uniref:TAXI family TRAP transporter solute-binding subunit n=1 Tax=Motiliproteus sediminis TaxID=1468178 RepID=UPI001AEFE875|nr:TAXI family TRAP transporter solute-binding subunit [Motiliproteus sediminis]